MSHTFTRQKLYDLVWTKPMKALAAEFELSDVGLAKACKEANIPRPARGYWAKLKAGKLVTRSVLPERGPGMHDAVVIDGGHRYNSSGYSDDDLLTLYPNPPVFEDSLEDVAARVTAMVGKVTVPKFPERAHRQIRLFLEADEERRQKQLSSKYTHSWDKPLFDDPFESRRLRLLNAIMTCLAMNGMKPSIQGKHARDLSVRIHDTNVRFTLDSVTQKRDFNPNIAIETRGQSKKLRLQILVWRSALESQMTWEDNDGTKLEKQLSEIVIGLIVSGEQQYRDGQQRHYEWLVERKARLIKKIQDAEAEAKRQEEERRIRLEQARVDRLLSDAESLRQAAEIRTYVEAVRNLSQDQRTSVTVDELNVWTAWALLQADRIDPVQNRRYIDSMKDDTISEMV